MEVAPVRDGVHGRLRHRGTLERRGPGQRRSRHTSLNGFCGVLSPMPFAGVWRVTESPLIARYRDSGNERERALGVPESSRCLTPRRTDIGTANEGTTRKHDVALHTQ